MENLSSLRVYLIVPKLIEQPTWGGRYILEYKGWGKKKLFKGLKIGQSYELFSEIKLRGDISSSDNPSFTGELGYAMEPDKVFYKGNKKNLIPIKRLIQENPQGVLGKKVIQKHGHNIKVLIKFTQARGNSFQIHVREEDGPQKWIYKPESFYYFEPGLLTLGVKKGIDWNGYKNCCLKISKEMKKLSQLVRRKKVSFSQAKRKATEIIKKYNPWQYVNLMKVKSDDLVDLSKGGLHHSWEEDNKNYPLGNVLYELNYEVMDPASVIRCFDKGKMKPDGTLRKIDIDEYFKYIDRSTKTNTPSSHLIKPEVMFEKSGIKVEGLLRTKHYSLDRLFVESKHGGKFTQTTGSFHHLFVKEGTIKVVYIGPEIKLTKGHSCFIPASIEKYTIKNLGEGKSEILKTYVS